MLVTNRSSPTSWIFEPSAFGHGLPAVPIVLGHAVFDGNDWILPHPLGPKLHHLIGCPLALVGLLEDILAARLVIELAGGRIERDADLRAGLVSGLGDGFEHNFERFFVGLEVGRESAFIADGCGVAALLQHAFQRVKYFGAHAQGFRKLGRAVRDDHELLRVHRIVGMRAAVENVHQRDGQQVGRDAAQIAIQRRHLRLRGGARGSHGDRQDRVGAELGFVRRAVEGDHGAIDRGLILGFHAH